MRTVTQMLLRWAPARVIAAYARRVLRELPGISAIEEIRVETAAGCVPRVTASIRLAPGRDPQAMCRSAALELFERLPPAELRILVAGETLPAEEGRLLRFPPL